MASAWRLGAAVAAVALVVLVLSTAWHQTYAPTTETKIVTVSPVLSTTVVTVTQTVDETVTVTNASNANAVYCDATSYNLPDTEQAFGTETTYTVGNQTYSSFTITSVSSPSVTTVTVSSYISETNQSGPSGSTFTSTSPSQYGSACDPSGCWTVITCTYLG